MSFYKSKDGIIFNRCAQEFHNGKCGLLSQMLVEYVGQHFPYGFAHSENCDKCFDKIIGTIIRKAVENNVLLDEITDCCKEIKNHFDSPEYIKLTKANFNVFHKRLLNISQMMFESLLKENNNYRNHKIALNSIKFVGILFLKDLATMKIMVNCHTGLLNRAKMVLEPFTEYFCTLFLMVHQRMTLHNGGKEFVNLCIQRLFTILSESGRYWEDLPNYVHYVLKINAYPIAFDSKNSSSIDHKSCRSNNNNKSDDSTVTNKSYSHKSTQCNPSHKSTQCNPTHKSTQCNPSYNVTNDTSYLVKPEMPEDIERSDDFDCFLEIIQHFKQFVVTSPNSEVFYSSMIENLMDWSIKNSDLVKVDGLKAICNHELDIYRNKSRLFHKTYCLKVLDNFGSVELDKTEMMRLKEKCQARTRGNKAIIFVADLYNKDLIEVNFVIEKLLFLLDPHFISNISLESFGILLKLTVTKLLTTYFDGPNMVVNFLVHVQEIIKITTCSLKVKYFLRDMIENINRNHDLNIENQQITKTYHAPQFPLKFTTPIHRPLWKPIKKAKRTLKLCT